MISQLKTLYEIRGIPTLVVLGKDGEILSNNARPEVQQNGLSGVKAVLSK